MNEDQIRPEVRVQMTALAKLIATQLPPGFGFALLVFEQNTPGGFMNWISTAKRDDMIPALKEFIAHIEGRFINEPGRPQ